MRWSRLVAMAALAMLAFATTFLLVVRGLTASADIWLTQAVFAALGGITSGPATWQSEAMRDFTALGSGTVLTTAVFMIAVLALAAGRWRVALILPAGLLVAAAVNLGIKGMVDRTRPDLLTYVPPTFTDSFPSGHAFLTLTVTLATALLLPASYPFLVRASAVSLALLLSFLVGLSRIVLGVHWPSDVFAGWCLGVAFAALIVAMAGTADSRKLHPNLGKEHPPARPR